MAATARRARRPCWWEASSWRSLSAASLAALLAGTVERNRKQLHKVDQEIRFVASKLANPQFLERAPAEIIEKERERQRELMDRRAALERNVERLSSL
jgi:valyl-tRNA synthetase